MTDSRSRYSTPARLIHWGMALLVLGMIPVGFLMVQKGLDRGLQNFLFISHKNTGVLLLILILMRMVYRWLNPPRQDSIVLPKAQQFIANAVHIGLYALLLIMPLAGYVRVKAGGFPIEALDAMGVPAFVPRSDAVAEVAKSVHFYGAYAIAILIVMHIGAAAFHGLVRRDGVVARMWPPLGPRT